MESLPDQVVLKFHPDTLTYIRSQYNLDKPGEMDRAIDILDNWLKKQNHFTVKNYHLMNGSKIIEQTFKAKPRKLPLRSSISLSQLINNTLSARNFLERQIILDKGSVERAKNQMEKLFTMKTIATSVIGKYDVKNDLKEVREFFAQTLMPKLTKDHYRIYATKALNDGFTAEQLSQAFTFASNILEYIRASDYCNGFVAIIDYRDIKILDLIAKLNLTELRQLIGYIMDGYQMRLKGLHILTVSKAADVLVKILKQMFSAKIGNRIQVHMTLESLHEHVSKDCLPEEFGGEQKSLLTLCDEFTDELGRKENIEYLREMGKAVVDESFRVGDKITKDDMLGITGSFRTITVD